jgi:proteasome lid subunit RPN8/RPN11
VIILREARDAIVAHALEASPNECCGILLGQTGWITIAVRARNLQESRTRYLIDPRDHIAACRTAREQQLDVIGFYHSHPHSAAEPSDSDVAEASYPEAVYLIVGLCGERPEVRAFMLGERGAVELTMETIAERQASDV